MGGGWVVVGGSTVNLVLALVQNYSLGFGFGLGPSWTISYQKIYNGNKTEQIKIFHRFEANLKVREKIQIERKEHTINIIKTRNKKRKKPPCDPLVDPLHCKKYSNG